MSTATTAPTPPVPNPGDDPRPGTDNGTNVPSDDPLGDRIAALCAHINAATYRLLTLLLKYDGWQGCRSCAHWLSWRTGISLGPAREKVRVARRLPSLPLISAALAKGEISYSKVRALTRIATADNEAEFPPSPQRNRGTRPRYSLYASPYCSSSHGSSASGAATNHSERRPFPTRPADRRAPPAAPRR